MLGVCSLYSIGCGKAIDQASRIRTKVDAVKAYASELAGVGEDPRAVGDSLMGVKEALDRKDADTAERLLDTILKDRKPVVKRQSVSTETSIDLFRKVEQVQISGYSETAMEPLVSPDGRYLFYNNSNEAGTKTRIHFARRLAANKFQYIGILEGSQSDSKDMAPAMDDNGTMYFTSVRDYEKTLKTLFVGSFVGEKITGVRSISGNISSRIPGWLNMDCDVSRDGRQFVYSRARFNPGSHLPSQSDLYLADIVNGDIQAVANSEAMMKNINTDELEYAPCLSKDGLELYFTRTKMNMMLGIVNGAKTRIMIARRMTLQDPFQEPLKINGIDGLVEGPTLSTDGDELFFHKRVGDIYAIFRASDRVK